MAVTRSPPNLGQEVSLATTNDRCLQVLQALSTPPLISTTTKQSANDGAANAQQRASYGSPGASLTGSLCIFVSPLLC